MNGTSRFFLLILQTKHNNSIELPRPLNFKHIYTICVFNHWCEMCACLCGDVAKNVP